MFGIGATEFVIIAVIAVLLFGTPILAFLLGYTVGKKSSGVHTDSTTRQDAEHEELSE